MARPWSTVSIISTVASSGSRTSSRVAAPRSSASAPRRNPSPQPRSARNRGEVTVADIKVMSAGAVKTMVAALGAEFERESGNKLNLNFGTAGALRERIKGGEVSDLVVLSESAIAELAKLGLVVAGTSADLGRTVTGVIVREGAAEPDISTPDAFKQ